LPDDEVHDALADPKIEAAAGYRIIPDDATAIEILGLIKQGNFGIDRAAVFGRPSGTQAPRGRRKR